MKTGDVITWERTFTREDVNLFSQMTGDEGNHHIESDGLGRVLVHGLLVAALPTKLGGEMNFLAREMTFNFVRPVFTGDKVECQVTVERVDKLEDQTKLWASWICRNQHDQEVMTGSARGSILKEN